MCATSKAYVLPFPKVTSRPYKIQHSLSLPWSNKLIAMSVATSSGFSSPSPNPPPPKMKRAKHACERCRKQKTKVRTFPIITFSPPSPSVTQCFNKDDGEPCEWCYQKGLICVYSDASSSQSNPGSSTPTSPTSPSPVAPPQSMAPHIIPALARQGPWSAVGPSTQATGPLSSSTGQSQSNTYAAPNYQ
jgi:hypothetical protein